MSTISENVLIIGASTKPSRYSYKAAEMLVRYGHTPILVGNKEGVINGMPILTKIPSDITIDTVTLYINQKIQPLYLQEIIKLNPKRVIFNPGTESNDTWKALHEANIKCIEACTLVMLRSNQY